MKTNLLRRADRARASAPRFPDATTWRAWQVAASVPNPAVPALTIGDLGILCDVTADDQSRVHVQLSPTYEGHPAMEHLCTDLVDALTLAGYLHVDVEFVPRPSESFAD